VLDYQENQGRHVSDDTPLCAKVLVWRCQEKGCDLADHVWTNPAEFVSVLQFHLMLDRNHYFENNRSESKNLAPLDDVQWAKNRLAVLQALDSFLTSAAALAKTFQDRLESDTSQPWNPPKDEHLMHNWKALGLSSMANLASTYMKSRAIA
jgi:hypothetical protein